MVNIDGEFKRILSLNLLISTRISSWDLCTLKMTKRFSGPLKHEHNYFLLETQENVIHVTFKVKISDTKLQLT